MSAHRVVSTGAARSAVRMSGLVACAARDCGLDEATVQRIAVVAVTRMLEERLILTAQVSA